MYYWAVYVTVNNVKQAKLLIVAVEKQQCFILSCRATKYFLLLSTK